MSKWRVRVSWDTEVEADDEGDALMEADRQFSFMSEARAEETGIEEEERRKVDRNTARVDEGN